MSENLHISRILPSARHSIKVRNSGKKWKTRPDRRFQKQLRREENERQNSEWKLNDDQDLTVNDIDLNSGLEISMTGHETDLDGRNTIDILV